MVFKSEDMMWREEEIIFVNPKHIISIEDYNMNPYIDKNNNIYKNFWGYKIITTANTLFISVKDREKTYEYLKSLTPDRG